MEQDYEAHGAMDGDMAGKHYTMLALNLAISLVIMYVAMFAMIWSTSDFYNNSNMFYMALVMWAPMGALMLLTMGMMYQNQRLNMVLHAAFVLSFVLAFWAIRDQSLVGDRQFVRAMIPHHSGATTMCNRASISDPEIRDLCFKPGGIVESQTREIAQMNEILKRL